MKKVALIFPILLIITGGSYGQKKSNGLRNMPSIGGHIGTLSYIGDIAGSKNGSALTDWKVGYGFYLEKKIGNVFGISMNGTFGKVSKSQLDENVFLNFESDIMAFDLNALFDFDNGLIFKKETAVVPFISVGVGYLTFNSKGDLMGNGNTYYHWSDGSLHDQSQTMLGSDTSSVEIKRDYHYESELQDSLVDYAKNSFFIPLRVGFKFKVTDNLGLRMSAAYMLTFTDYIDNVAGGANDRLFSTNISLQYNFGSHSSTKPDDKYKDFDFSTIDDSDFDGDGVIDRKDLCQGTPKGVGVDNKGCPLDGDGDGVADYLDKELDTPGGTIVNEEGVTLTDEMIALQEKMKDSVVTEYKVFTAEELSKDEIDEIQKQYMEANNASSNTEQKIPEIFKALDIDGDKFISAKEVTGAIDGFFEGENNLTAKNLNELIDYYFDQ